ncbi:GNAT family N-acetyltransferase [Streptomyces sp. NPDC001219]
MHDLVRTTDGSWWPANVQTPRLVLRPVAEDDLRVAERLWRDERVRRYLGGPVSEAKIAVRRRTLPGSPGAFAITARDTNATIGMITIDPHSRRGATAVSYTLLPEHWGAGVGREAVAAALAWARSLPGTDRVVAVTQTVNRASRRLLEAVGMRECGEMVEHGHPQIMYCG